MPNSFFSKKNRRIRPSPKSTNAQTRIQLIKAPLCSNAVGQTTTNKVFSELLQNIGQKQWEPKRLIPPFTDSTLNEINLAPGATSVADQYMDIALDTYKALSIPVTFKKGEQPVLGRTTLLQFEAPASSNNVLYTGVALKQLRQGETPAALKRELSMQALLANDPTFHSTFPRPLHSVKSASHFVTFAVPDGYYDYLSEIKDTNTFTEAACRAAHDLGYLLTQYGQVFPGLISIFHAKDRPYTLLPDLTKAQAVHFGGLPGKIEDVIGKKLYENIGRTGLRDLGDLESIDNYQLLTADGKGAVLSMPLKIAHFVSLYLMIFTLLIGNRSRLLEQDEEDKAAWCDNDKIFSAILSSLFEGLGIKSTSEILSYIDPSLLKDNAPRMQPSEKFNRQLYFCFTRFKDSVFGTKSIAPGEESDKHQPQLESYFGTKKVTFYCGDGGDYMESFTFEGVRHRNFYYGGKPFSNETKQADFDLREGWLGQYSGINPLTTACKYALRAAEVVTRTLYDIAIQMAAPNSSSPNASPNTSPSVSLSSTLFDQTLNHTNGQPISNSKLDNLTDIVNELRAKTNANTGNYVQEAFEMLTALKARYLSLATDPNDSASKKAVAVSRTITQLSTAQSLDKAQLDKLLKTLECDSDFSAYRWFSGRKGAKSKQLATNLGSNTGVVAIQYLMEKYSN